MQSGIGCSNRLVRIATNVSDMDAGLPPPPNSNFLDDGVDVDCEPHDGLEFNSHEAGYSFYQEYAKSMGFTTSIKNSRRSKKTKEFIDAKFACSRYGVTPDTDGGSSSSSRRPAVKKTDCKASMHVKRKKDGKWYIHEFIKVHNHELLPALAYHFRIHRNVKLAEKNNIDILHAVSERTRKMYVEMFRQSSGVNKFSYVKSNLNHQLDRGRSLALEEGGAQVMLEYFMHAQKESPFFFYAIDLNEEQRLRNLFWIDAKSRKDYINFSDVVFLDISYIKSNEKMPFAPFIGVNHHFQPMLLGSALLADISKPTIVWILKTWLRAMGGQAPRVIITDQDNTLKSAVEEVLPDARHCFALWHILEKIPETLAHVIKHNVNFIRKFNKCIFKSLTDEQFNMKWWKMVARFDLQENKWIHSLFDDRGKWVPAYMRDVFLAGMSSGQRSESLNSFLDKYIQKRITLKEFIRQYDAILQNRSKEEAIADFDTLHKQPALKSPSPWEKKTSTIYTHTIFKKFQVEVLGVIGCRPKKDSENGGTITYRVEDCEKSETFMVMWNEVHSDVSCSCLLFEFKGFLCRHALIVFQMCGLSTIPSKYILKRWTKDAKDRLSVPEGTERIHTRVQRYNDLCRRSIELGEEGSLSEPSYNIAYRTLVEALKNCVNVNNKYATDSGSGSLILREVEVESKGGHQTKTTKKKSVNKKRKVSSEPQAIMAETPDSFQAIENLSSDGVSLNNYYESQQSVQRLIQLNLMEPPHDGYYANQPNMQGLGQLNSVTQSHDGFFVAQPSMPGLGHLDLRSQSFNYVLQDDPSIRPSLLHGGSARHP